MVAPFPYDEANIFQHLAMTWAFPLINHYKKTPPSQKNLIEIPKSIDYDNKQEEIA